MAPTWMHNPALGELARVNVAPEDTGGRLAQSDVWLQPGAAVAGEHVHDHVTERFEVLAGRVGFGVDGRERTVAGGEGPVEVAAGRPHDWWNADAGVAHVRVTVEALPNAPGAPAARFVSMIELLWSLGALGRLNERGLPDLLWLAAIAREFRDAIRFTSPPALVQTALFAPLAALARRAGRDPLDGSLHGLRAPCVIPEPSEVRLQELLARPVGVRAARGHG